MVAFAGYDMPVQYGGERGGVLVEHRWTREHAGLFDVSHMGPAWLHLADRTGDAEADHHAIAARIETLVCGDIDGLRPGRLRYTLLMNDGGGIVDDLLVGRPAEVEAQGSLYVVVNAGTKERVFHSIASAAGEGVRLERADDGALLAVQGPEAESVVERLYPGASSLAFMSFRRFDVGGYGVAVARSGYTGEDGFEILAPPELARETWERLVADPRVTPVGLGARDSLRLEAGLPLYGHDIDASTSPIEAGLGFAVSKRRRQAADFPGAARVLAEVAAAPSRVRIGLRLRPGAPPAREGAEVRHEGARVGVVTSGGPSPSLGGAIARALVGPAHAALGERLQLVVRDRIYEAEVVPLPFIPHRYVRAPVAPFRTGA